LGDPASWWWTSPDRSATPSQSRVHTACSSASGTDIGLVALAVDVDEVRRVIAINPSR
jgi:hypothetical protein